MNPSYRGVSMGFQMLDELQEKYPDVSIRATEIQSLIGEAAGKEKEERVNELTEIHIKLDVFENLSMRCFI